MIKKDDIELITKYLPKRLQEININTFDSDQDHECQTAVTFDNQFKFFKSLLEWIGKSSIIVISFNFFCISIEFWQVNHDLLSLLFKVLSKDLVQKLQGYNCIVFAENENNINNSNFANQLTMDKFISQEKKYCKNNFHCIADYENKYNSFIKLILTSILNQGVYSLTTLHVDDRFKLVKMTTDDQKNVENENKENLKQTNFSTQWNVPQQLYNYFEIESTTQQEQQSASTSNNKGLKKFSKLTELCIASQFIYYTDAIYLCKYINNIFFPKLRSLNLLFLVLHLIVNEYSDLLNEEDVQLLSNYHDSLKKLLSMTIDCYDWSSPTTLSSHKRIKFFTYLIQLIASSSIMQFSMYNIKWQQVLIKVIL